MAHINKFSVTALTGRQTTYSQQLDRNLNVFFGPNGSGKTSLLRLMNSAMEDNASSIRNVPFDSAEFTVYSVKYQQEFSRSISSTFKQARTQPTSSAVSRQGILSSVQAPAKIPWATMPDEDQLKGNFFHRFLPITRLYLSEQESLFGSSFNASPDETLNQQFTEAIAGLWRTYTAQINASIAQAQQSGLARLFQDVLMGSEPAPLAESLGDSLNAYEQIQSFLKRTEGFQHILPSYESFSRRYQSEPRLQDLVNKIREIEKNVAQALTPRKHLQALLNRLFSKGKTVIFTDTEIDVEVGDQIRIGIAQLSSGEKQLIRIFLDTLLAEANTILIDEPELSMHIDWQRVLLNSMRELNPQAQIIVATHSPEIMADVPDQNIFEI